MKKTLVFLFLPIALLGISSCTAPVTNKSEQILPDPIKLVGIYGEDDVSSKFYVSFGNESRVKPIRIVLGSYKKSDYEISKIELNVTGSENISVFLDSNNNKVLDDNEKSTLTPINGNVSLNWGDISYTNTVSNLALYCQNEWPEEFTLSVSKLEYVVLSNNETKTASLENNKLAIYNFSSVSDYININVLPGSESKLYEATYEVTATSPFKAIGDKTRTYKGLTGDISIDYEIELNDGLTYEGKYEYTLPIQKHVHQIVEEKMNGQCKEIVCSCGVYSLYQFDTEKAIDGDTPDINEPDDRLGVRRMGYSWQTSNVKKGKYDIYVKGYLEPNHPERGWWVPEATEDEGPYAYYLSVLNSETNIHPCRDIERTYVDTFPTSDSFVWTNKRIYEMEIKDDIEGISFTSGNYNGKMYEHSIHISSILFVPQNAGFDIANF